MRNKWSHYLSLILTVFGLLTLVGLLIGEVAWTLLVGSLGYLTWTLLQLYRLHRWLNHSDPESSPPESAGLWGDIFDGIHRLQKHHTKAQQRLQNYVDRIQESANSLKDGVIMTDSRGCMEWWNDAANNLLGFKFPSDQGQRIYNLVRQPEFQRYFEKKNYSTPIELTSPNNPMVHLKFNISTFGEGDRLIVVQDVTQLHRLEQMRKDFVSNVSHELRTPLTVISGYLETINDHLDQLPAKWHRAFRTMDMQSFRMKNLISDLLLLSKFETSDARTNQAKVNMRTLLSGLRQDAEALNTEKKHQIHFTVEAGDIMGNEQQLRSAFSNLVFNAIKYTPAGGQIDVLWTKERQGAYFSVTDSGKGFDPYHIPRLTERFYRVDSGRDSTEGGTGLGLAIVKHVLINHDGALKIHSQPGMGSEFTCTFPNARYVPHTPEDVAV